MRYEKSSDMTHLAKLITILIFVVLFPVSALFAQKGKKELTIDMLSQTDQIVPPEPRQVIWRPHTDQFSFIEPVSTGGEDAIWLYDAETSQKHILIDLSTAAEHKGLPLDLNSYQWSPDGNYILLEGERTLC